MRKVMVLGVPVTDVVTHLIILVTIGAVTILLGVPLFDRVVRK